MLLLRLWPPMLLLLLPPLLLLRLLSYTREQQRLPPPEDPASPRGSWYNDEIIEAHSHLLRREQPKINGVMHNNDVITGPKFTYFMTQLHEADPVRDVASITGWTTRFVMPWREVIRKAKPNNIYIPYQANDSHWILLCVSTR
jgi:Ulp1 family protease